MAINSTVTRLAGNLDRDEAGLPEQSLAQALKSIRGHGLELCQQCLSPRGVHFLGIFIYGGWFVGNLIVIG